MNEQKNLLFICFKIISSLYQECVSLKEGVAFSGAIANEKRLLSFLDREELGGILAEFFKKGIHLLSLQEERAHFLMSLEYEFILMVKKAQTDEEVRALVLARCLLDGFDLQGRSPSPIPQFITTQMYYELEPEQQREIFSILAGPGKSIGMI